MTDPALGRGLDHATALVDRPVAEAASVSKRYGNTVALDGVTMAIRPGESHALVGRNGAGKSTLVALLTGLQAPDGGEVRFGGEPAPPLGDREAWRQRVACVYQKSTIIPALSVAENLYLNRQAGRGPISWRRLRTDAQAVLDEWSLPVNPVQPAGDLNVEQQQMLEIARALSHGARFIILDEPTAQLDGAAIQRLFRRLRGLQDQGVTFLFISHHLDEIYEVCQAVTVLRDGRHVVTSPVSAMPRPRLVEAMTGEATGLTDTSVDRPVVAAQAPVVLSAQGLRIPGEYEQFDVTVRAGEVVGLAGGGASGALEVGETIVGLRSPRTGAVEVGGRQIRAGGRSPSGSSAIWTSKPTARSSWCPGCPAATSRRSSWRGRCPASRRCWCCSARPPGSTSGPRSRCWAWWTRRPAAGRPSSSSPTRSTTCGS